MLDYLKQFDEELNKRIKTLELNIRSASPSFFDTFRSIAECFVRRIAKDNGIETTATSFKKLISIPELKSVLTETIGIPVYALKKCQDYISKINKHVHESEKEINENFVVEYVLCLYELTSPLFSSATPPQISEILAMYDSLDREIEKEKARLLEEQNRLILENNELLHLVSEKLEKEDTRGKTPPLSAPSESENQATARNLLFDFMRTSRQHLTFMGSEQAVNKKRKIALWFIIATLAFSLIETIFSIVLNSYYSTFICFLNFWHFALIFILIKFIRKSQIIRNVSSRTVRCTEYNGYGILKAGAMKKRYKAAFIFGMLGAALEIVLALISDYSKSGEAAVPMFITVVALAALLSGITLFLVRRYFEDLSITVITSTTKKKEDGSPLTLYFLMDKFINEDTYLKLRSANSK